MASPQLQSSGMLSREQFLHLFNRFTFLVSQPDVKRKTADAVKDKQEAVAVTTAIQEEIFLEMGVGEISTQGGNAIIFEKRIGEYQKASVMSSINGNADTRVFKLDEDF